MHNTIPCRVAPANCHIKVSGQCPVCEIGVEDIKHLLFKCSRAKHVWQALGIDDLIEKFCLAHRPGQSILEELLYSSPGQSMILGQAPLAELVAVACWYLWWERRQISRNIQVQSPERSVVAIKVLSSNFRYRS